VRVIGYIAAAWAAFLLLLVAVAWWRGDE